MGVDQQRFGRAFGFSIGDDLGDIGGIDAGCGFVFGVHDGVDSATVGIVENQINGKALVASDGVGLLNLQSPLGVKVLLEPSGDKAFVEPRHVHDKGEGRSVAQEVRRAVMFQEKGAKPMQQRIILDRKSVV